MDRRVANHRISIVPFRPRYQQRVHCWRMWSAASERGGGVCTPRETEEGAEEEPVASAWSCDTPLTQG